MSEKTKLRTHQTRVISHEDFEKYAVIPKDQLDIIYNSVSILDRQLNHLQKILQVNGINDSYYNEGITLTLKDIKIEGMDTSDRSATIKGNDKRVVY